MRLPDESLSRLVLSESFARDKFSEAVVALALDVRTIGMVRELERTWIDGNVFVCEMQRCSWRWDSKKLP